ncbi:MAG: metallophosphoesterase family protein [bacterium]|nr:metallophosphoesterase family protein [bacterium]
MQLGIISDTHGQLPIELFDHLAGCAEILHLGDLGPLGLLRDLRTIAPTTVVCGNTDAPGRPDLPPHRKLTVEGLPIFMRHHPWSRYDLEPELPALYLHGHTHVPHLEQVGPATILCPGSITNPREDNPASLVLLDLKPCLIHVTMIAIQDGRVILQRAWPYA